jgi:RNA polymerase sigma-70 factor (ECF subfamily)
LAINDIGTDSFTDFVRTTERPLRVALGAAFGKQRGREAAADALAYGWEHWEQVEQMENPAGYLYRVGENRAKSMKRRVPALRPVDVDGDPWIEPGLPAVLEQLSEQQRVVVALLYGYQWSMSEVAELLDVSKSTVQSHAERGLARLRAGLGVEV